MKNKRKHIAHRMAIGAVTVCIMVLLSGCGKGKETQSFNLFTWDGMFPQEVLSG